MISERDKLKFMGDFLDYNEPGQRINRLDKRYDVVVVGGGIAGVSAAMSAANAHGKVLLIEKMYGLGGLATLGLVTIFLPLCDGMGHQVSFGNAEKLLRLSISKGYERDFPKTWIDRECVHGSERYQVRYNANIFSILMEQELNDCGVDILFGTNVSRVIREENRIGGIIVDNVQGRTYIEVRSIVDATGDAVIYNMASDKTREYEPGNSLAAWYYETAEGKNELHMLGAADVLPSDIDSEIPVQLVNKRISGLDIHELSKAIIKSHKYSVDAFLENGNVSERHSLASIATLPQLRMTRCIIGSKVIDVRDSHKYIEDSVGMISDWKTRDVVLEVPFGCIHTDDICNMVAAGRIVSATNEAWDITRVIPAAAVTGQAAGVAAAMTDRIDRINIKELQKKLREQNVVIHEKDISSGC